MRLIFAAFLLFSSTLCTAQSKIPTTYFNDPLDIDIILAGDFGELRSNHFHSGLDIKTQQHTGLPVQASAEGYISRIKISHYGYGKALYIQHPNGYTTVYGHLSRFAPKIEKYIKKIQYEKESYEVESFPSSDALQVEQGELIAYSGNTGGSGGPHLHFEIRDGGQRPMNPLLFGIQVEDTRNPTINAVVVYPMGKQGHVNNSAKKQELKLISVGDGSFRTEPITACGKIGFGISAIDRFNGASNRNGVFRITSVLNGDQVFQADFKKFSFSETRYINQFVDYEYYQKNDDKIQKLFVAPNNPLSIYSNLSHRGKINVQDSLSYNYTITVTDYAGNKSMVTIPIIGKQGVNVIPKEDKTTNYFVAANQATVFEQNGIDVYIPKNSLYEDAYLDISFEDELLKFHKDVIPIQKRITIGFDVSKYKPEERKHMFIARLSDYGNPYYTSTKKEGDRFTTRTRTFGTYTLARDTVPPILSPVNFSDGQWISNNETIKVKINDEYSGINSYRATVNGAFILMEYEYKDDMLTHYFRDDVLKETENQLKIIAIDNAGNTTTFESTFFRKDVE